MIFEFTFTKLHLTMCCVFKRFAPTASVPGGGRMASVCMCTGGPLVPLTGVIDCPTMGRICSQDIGKPAPATTVKACGGRFTEPDVG